MIDDIFEARRESGFATAYAAVGKAQQALDDAGTKAGQALRVALERALRKPPRTADVFSVRVGADSIEFLVKGDGLDAAAIRAAAEAVAVPGGWEVQEYGSGFRGMRKGKAPRI